MVNISTYAQSIIQGVSKISEHNSCVSSPHQSKEKVHNKICQRTLSFRGAATAFARPQSFRFLSVGTLCSFPISNQGTLHQCICDTCQPIRNCSGTFERVLKSMIRRFRTRTDTGEGYSYLLFEL